MEDIRAGDICYINGKDAYKTYGADLYSLEPGAGAITANYHYSAGSLIGYGGKRGERSLRLQFYVFGETAKEREKNTSNLITGCQDCQIDVISRYEGEEKTGILHYQAVLTGVQSTPYTIEAYNLVTLNFAAIQKGEKRTVSLSIKRLRVEGNAKAPCRIILRPQTAVSSLSILGMTVKNLKAKEEFVIDGIKKKVTRNGLNALKDTDIVRFPQLSPGWNELYMSQEVPGEIVYYPIYQ